MRTTRLTQKESLAKWAVAFLVIPVFLALLAAGVKPAVSRGLVLTQSPATHLAVAHLQDELDLRYPPGSRVVTADEAFQRFEVLSQGLIAAGDPQVSYEGDRVLFCGKSTATADWQIYQVQLPGGAPRAITSVLGGARNPLWLPDGEVIFVSPTVRSGSSNLAGAIYTIRPGGQPRRVTFTPAEISDPTLLADGRVLFVSHRPCEPGGETGRYNLSTINHDGTELTEFAELKNPAELLQRPKPLPDGRIVLQVSSDPGSAIKSEAEYIRSSRPFSGAEPFLAEVGRITFVQPIASGDLLVCADPTQGPGTTSASSFLYRMSVLSSRLAEPLFKDPAWNTLEAAELCRHVPPMGRISTVDSTKKTGQLLCLNANFRAEASPADSPDRLASRVRILVGVPSSGVRVLGEVPVQPDGSFMVEVPADVPLGFETVDGHGQRLSRLAPSIWVRPGENRGCIGCHEPHNQSPRNARPLAVRVPVPQLPLEPLNLAQRKP
jgi:hypothetical protein